METRLYSPSRKSWQDPTTGSCRILKQDPVQDPRQDPTGSYRILDRILQDPIGS